MAYFHDTEMESKPFVGIPKSPKPVNDDVFILDRQRRAALEEVDGARFSWFHAKVVVVAGVGFFTDAYDIFAISIAFVMLGYVYGGDGGGGNSDAWASPKLSSKQELLIKIATQIGNLVGQLGFGWLADVLGRKRMYGFELMVIIVSTFGQAVSGDSRAVPIVTILVVWRFFMGVGIGGDYPLSAIIASEFASTKIRGRMMTAVFASQGWGNFTAALVAFIITAGYKPDILKDISAIDHTWRLLIGFGCVPAAVALYFRLTIPETPRFTMDIELNIEQATTDIRRVLNDSEHEEEEQAIQRIEVPRATWKDFRAYFGQWSNLQVLLATSYSWFVLDISFYGLGLNSPNILTAIGFSRPATGLTGNAAIQSHLERLCTGNLILSVAGLIPGYWVSFFFIDSWGRKPIQYMGFIVLTIIFMIMGFGYDALHESKAFIFLYCLANFFQNFGPNVTTFIIPGEVFPTRYRATGHGISAASGKLGAIVAQLIAHAGTDYDKLETDVAQDGRKIKIMLIVFAFCMLSGVVSTYFLPEPKGQSLETLSNEPQEGFVTGSRGRRR